MRKLKVYGWLAVVEPGEAEILGLPSHYVQVRAVVAATSRASAARLAGYDRPMQMFNLCETGNTEEIEAAMSDVGAVFVHPDYGPTQGLFHKRIKS